MRSGRRRVSRVSGVIFGRRDWLSGTRGCDWVEGYFEDALRYDWNDGGSFVYIYCMYEAATVKVFSRIEEATLESLHWKVMQVL